jgi:exosome complex component RRP40
MRCGSQDCDTIQVTSAGRLRLSKPNKYWVENSQKRVSPLVCAHICFNIVDIVTLFRDPICEF